MLPSTTLKDLLSAMIAATAVFDPADCFVGLFTDWPGAVPGLVIGDLTEPSYTGYARQALTAWGEVGIESDGSARVVHPSVEFSPTATTEGDLIIGAFLADDVAAGALLQAALFSVPFTLAKLTDVRSVVVGLRLPFAGPFDSVLDVG